MKNKMSHLTFFRLIFFVLSFLFSFLFPVSFFFVVSNPPDLGLVVIHFPSLFFFLFLPFLFVIASILWTYNKRTLLVLPYLYVIYVYKNIICLGFIDEFRLFFMFKFHLTNCFLYNKLFYPVFVALLTGWIFFLPFAFISSFLKYKDE